MKFAKKLLASKRLAQTGSLTDSTADPKTTSTESGGRPIKDDKAQVAPSEIPQTPVASPSEKRDVKLRKPQELITLQLSTSPGDVSNVPYTRAGRSRNASEYDRSYSPLLDSQTSLYPKGNTLPIGSAPTGAYFSQTPTQGAPLSKKKVKPQAERRELSVVRPSPLSKVEAQSVIQEAPTHRRHLEDFLGKQEDEFATDSTAVLPLHKQLRPALEMENGSIAYGDRARSHAQVMEALVALLEAKYVGASFEELLDEVQTQIKSLGFYNPAKKIYWKRDAQRLATAKIKQVEIELSGEVTYDALCAFLDDHYPLSYLSELDNGIAVLYTDETGVKALQTLVAHYWDIVSTSRHAQLAPPTEEALQYTVTQGAKYALGKLHTDESFSTPEQGFDDALTFEFNNGAIVIYRFRSSEKKGAINSVLVGAGKHGKYLYGIVYDYLRKHGYHVEPDSGYTPAGMSRRMLVLKSQISKHGDDKHFTVGFDNLKDAWENQIVKFNKLLRLYKLPDFPQEEVSNGVHALEAARLAWPRLSNEQKIQVLHDINGMINRATARFMLSQVAGKAKSGITHVALQNNNLVFWLDNGKVAIYKPSEVANYFLQNPQNALKTIQELDTAATR